MTQESPHGWPLQNVRERIYKKIFTKNVFDKYLSYFCVLSLFSIFLHADRSHKNYNWIILDQILVIGLLYMT